MHYQVAPEKMVNIKGIMFEDTGYPFLIHVQSSGSESESWASILL